MKMRNVLAVFVLSGIWHGANWTFVFWGALNALLFLPLILGKVHRSHLDTVSHGRILPSFKDTYMMFTTFSITCVCWVFFRAESVHVAFSYIGQAVERIFSNPKETFMSLPLSPSELTFDFATLLASFLTLFTIDWIQRDKSHGLFELPFPRALNFGVYLFLAVLVAEYFFGRGSFIYFQF